jgi:hypothetical protein
MRYVLVATFDTEDEVAAAQDRIADAGATTSVYFDVADDDEVGLFIEGDIAWAMKTDDEEGA